MTPRTPEDDARDQRRMMIAAVLSLAILLGFHFFFDKPQAQKLSQEQAVKAAQEVGTRKVFEGIKPRADMLAQSTRIPVKGALISGSISLTGARLDDLTLNDYYETLDKKDHVALLTPAGSALSRYVESGWLTDAKDDGLPSADTVWTLTPDSAKTLESNGKPVTLTWNNSKGFVFEKSFEMDDKYLITVSQKIKNVSAPEKSFHAFHVVAFNDLPPELLGKKSDNAFAAIHEGPVGVINGKMHAPAYSDLLKGELTEEKSTQGWVGMTEKYWMTAVFPADKADKFDARMMGVQQGVTKHYQSDMVMEAKSVAQGQTLENKVHIFTGVKSLDVIQAYEEQKGLKDLERGIDFGIWYFIVKPFYLVFIFLVHHLHYVGLAILVMTVLVKAATFPLTSTSMRSMAKMKLVQPLIEAAKKKHGSDKERLQQEIFEIYKRENANPFSSCFPMFLQIPIFFSLYKVMLLSVEMRHAPFWGWISDLAAPDHTSVLTLFGLIPWETPSALHIGAWPLLLILTMFLQSRLMPPAADPAQERIQKIMPLVFGYMMSSFASGLVIYWTWSNILGMLQQVYITNQISEHKTHILLGHSQRRKKTS